MNRRTFWIAGSAVLGGTFAASVGTAAAQTPGWGSMMGGSRRGFGGMMGSSTRGPEDMMGSSACGSEDMMEPSQAPASATGEPLTIEQAAEQVRTYLETSGWTGLAVTEVMEFSNHFYAQVGNPKQDTQALELIIDRTTGTVSPEMGPNMMWNTQYGHMAGWGGARGPMGWWGSMMGTMMGWWGGMRGGAWRQDGAKTPGESRLDAEAATAAAQRWLDRFLPGLTAADATPFPGYYTLHTVRDGRIEGMLSVHAQTGDVWYHSWHGAYVRSLGEHE